MCRIYALLYKIIPLKSFQRYVIRQHFSRCPRCGLGKDLDVQIKDLFQSSFDWIKLEDTFWPRVLARFEQRTIHQEETKRWIQAQPAWRWILAGLAFACFVVLNILLIQALDQNQHSENLTQPRIKLTYVKIKGKDAKSYIYHTPRKTFILFSEIDKRRE